MPKRLEEAFKRSARKAGIEEGSDRWGAYVYGGMKKAEEKAKDAGEGDRREDDGHHDRDGVSS